MHLEKIKSSQVTGLLMHDVRSSDNHANQDIDVYRSHLNYNLVSGDPFKNLRERLDQLEYIKKKSTNVLCSWAVTCPKQLTDPEDQKRFFQSAFDFLADRYGRKNVISAAVHLDESTPHMHFKFVPAILEDGIEKLNCKAVINRAELQRVHRDAEKYISQQFGIDGLILNGATANGNRTVTELKVERLKKEKTQLEDKVQDTAATLQQIETRLDAVQAAASAAKQIKPKKAPEPEIKKIPLVKDAYVPLSQYNELKEAYNDLGDRYAKTYNGLQAAEVKIKALNSELDKSRGSMMMNVRLQGDLKRATERLELLEGFYQATLQFFKERLPDALDRFVNWLPRKIRDDLLHPSRKQSRSIDFDR